MKLRALVFVGVLALAGSPALAIDWLAGGSIGDATIEVESGGASFDSSDTAWKVFGGLRAFKYFGVEGGYQDLGSAEMSVSGMSLSADVTGWNTYAVGVIPIHKFELFGKVGFMLWEADNTVDFGGGAISATTDGSDLAYGAGGAFKATEHLAIRGEWEQFQVEDTDSVSMFSLGLDWRF